VRYADDLVAGFEHEDDASPFLDEMRERFAAFSLPLHPVKTRVIEFGRRAAVNPKKRSLSRADIFAFLGSPSSAVNGAGATSNFSRRPGATVCGRSSRKTRRSCGCEYARLSQIRATGWRRSLQAISLTMRYPQISLAEQLPEYRSNLEAKIRSLPVLVSGGGVFGRLTSMVRELDGLQSLRACTRVKTVNPTSPCMMMAAKTEQRKKSDQHGQSYRRHPAQMPSAQPAYRRCQQKAQQYSERNRDDDVARKI
jgi:hypothetical protein